MSTTSSRSVWAARFALIFTFAILLPLTAPSVHAGDNGVLKLMVTTCSGNQIDNAHVSAVIVRDGLGLGQTGSGYTDDGYVEIAFINLEDGDEAHCTVTPPGGRPEKGHVYVWRDGSLRETGWQPSPEPEGLCEDGWWDEDLGIIHCAYGG